jgi:hypothetical protein
MHHEPLGAMACGSHLQGAILPVVTRLLPFASTVTHLSLARLSLDRIPPEVRIVALTGTDSRTNGYG